MLIALGAGLGSVGGGWRVAGLAVSLAALLASGGTLIVLMRVRAELLALNATTEAARAVRPQSRPKYSRRQAVVGPLT